MLDAVAAAIARDRGRLRPRAGSSTPRTCSNGLTSRQREVMALVTTGLPNKEIAAEMGLSEITVKIHRGHMMKKMRARSLADLIKMAQTLGINRQKLA